jgi:hypothetical protein
MFTENVIRMGKITRKRVEIKKSSGGSRKGLVTKLNRTWHLKNRRSLFSKKAENNVIKNDQDLK